MKILPVPLIKQADAYTIKNEPIKDIDLMERAAQACFHWLEKKITADQKIKVFCGPGNNGGDGLAVARMLHLSDYHVEVYTISSPDKMSESCRINFERMQECRNAGNANNAENAGMQECRLLEKTGDFPGIEQKDVVIDAIFGSGLTRPVEGFAELVIDHINASGATKIAIDVPSGLFCDATVRTFQKPSIIRADYTLTFSPPKLAFFFPENDTFTGDWQLLDIGIMTDFIDKAEVKNLMLEREFISQILKKRNKFAHKGMFGHALLICGSTGKMGAGVLAARACLRSGAGLVTVHVPISGIEIMQTAVPEAMLALGVNQDFFTDVPDLSPFSSIAVGPGIGTEGYTEDALKLLIQESKVPILFDADAINLLSENKTWLGFLPKNSIFTPHPKEFERLVGKSSNDFQRNQMHRDFSFKYHCYVVLKGAHSAITTPDGHCFFNSTGNPGMATGGSGDVLTGIIAGLMAQGYSSLESCLLGVYIHGKAGDFALTEQGYEALIANDIITNLGKSFQSLYGKF